MNTSGTTLGTNLVTRRREATQLGIAHAALRLFTEQGLSSTTVEEIAARSGVGIRTFYRYFPRKQDAVIPLLTSGAAEWRAELAALSPGAMLRPAVADIIASRLRADDERSRANLALTRELIRTITADRDLQRVWFDVNGDSEEQLVPVFADLASADDPLVARLLAAAATDAIRIALELWSASDAPDAPGPDVIARDCFWRLTEWYAGSASE